MDVPVGKHWESLIRKLVQAGRYDSASDVVGEGLRLVEEREAKLAALRQTIERSIEEGGDLSDDDVSAAIDARVRELRTKAS